MIHSHKMKPISAIFCIYFMWTAKTRANVLGSNNIQPIGPQPFKTEGSPPLEITPQHSLSPDIAPPTEHSNVPIYEELDLTDGGFSKFQNLNDEDNQLNLTLNLLSSFNNDSSNVFPTSGDIKSIDSSADQSTTVTKPSGTLYVDSVHKFQHSSIPFRIGIGSASRCKIGGDIGDADDEDVHHLSASQFGFPKSIVSKAVEDSPFKSVLVVLARLQYIYASKHQQSESEHTRKADEIVEREKQFGPFSEAVSKSSISDPFDIVSEMSHDLHDHAENSNAPGNSYIDGGYMERGTNGVSNSFLPATEYQNSFRAFDDSDGDADHFTPHLLKGSAFASAKHSSNDVDNVGNNWSFVTDGNEIREAPRHSPKTSTSSAQSSYNTLSGLSATQLGTSSRGDNKQTNQNPFSKLLPDVSRSNSWSLLSNGGYGSYEDFSKQRTYPNRKGNKLSEMMTNLFPAKQSENLPEISGLKDLIPKNNPVIQSSDKQKSKLDSLFEFNVQSILGSIPGYSLGSGSDKSGSESFSSSSGSDNSNSFGFFGGSKGSISSDSNNVNPSLLSANDRGSPNVAEINDLTNAHNEIRFAQYRSRKKRDASGRQSTSKDSCQSTYHTLHQYKNYGGACFVVLPEVQAVQFATCPESSCSGCAVNGGVSRCRAVRVPMWVWSYCEAGPSAGLVVPDRVSVSVACTCKISYCKQIPLGRS